MSKYFKIAKSNYDKGLWNKAMIAHLVEIGKLTAAEYKLITGEDYEP